MDIDRNGLDVLDREECFRLLEAATIGRVGLCSGALPTVLPVNFVRTERGIVFRTGAGTKLDAATDNAVVAFEVDDIDPLTHSGWSVVVTGMAHALSDPEEIAVAAQLPIAHWGLGSADRFVRIDPQLVTGRRIRAGAPRTGTRSALAVQ